MSYMAAQKVPRTYGRTAKMSAVWGFGGKLASQGVLLVVSIFLARLLTPADFGITAAARFFVTLATRLTQLGLNASLVRMKEIRPEHASSVFVVNVGAGLLAFACLRFASPFLGRFFGSDDVARVLPVTSLVFLITPFGTVAAAMLARNLRYKASTSIQVLDGISGSVIALALAVFGFGYWSLVYGALGGAVLSTGAKLWMSPWKPSVRFSTAALRDTLSFGIGFQAKNLIAFSAANLDNLVIGRFLGVTGLGYYDKAYGLMNQLNSRLALDGALMRIYAMLRDEPMRWRKALLKAIRATSIVTLPLLATVASLADDVIVVFFGPQWFPSIGPFRVLSMAAMIRSAMRPLNGANEAIGLVWYQTGQQLLTLAVVVIGVALGSQWGLTWASVGVLAGAVVHASLGVHLVTANSKVTGGDLWQALWPSAATAAAVALAALGVRWAVSTLDGVPVWVELAAGFIGAVLAYGAAVLWTPFHSVRDTVREVVDDVAPWLRRTMPLGILRQEPGESPATTGL